MNGPPCQIKFQFCWVPLIGGIKLQLLCGVKMELAVGSLPYPGNYLDIQFLSPAGLPICKHCLDVRQNPSRDTHFPSYGRRPLPNPKKIKRGVSAGGQGRATAPQFFENFTNFPLNFIPKTCKVRSFLMFRPLRFREVVTPLPHF